MWYYCASVHAVGGFRLLLWFLPGYAMTTASKPGVPWSALDVFVPSLFGRPHAPVLGSGKTGQDRHVCVCVCMYMYVYVHLLFTVFYVFA